MIISKLDFSNIALVGLCAVVLAGCGESDLKELQEQELDDVIAQLNAPDTGSANPGSEGNAGGEQNPSGIDLSQYDLVFSDDFDGNSLDPRNWNTSLAWGPDFVIYEQQQYYVDTDTNPDFGYDPFTVADGNLTISAVPTPENLRAAANEQPWLSGVLTTRDTFDLTYGYIEMRVDVPVGRGLWPALWMLGSGSNGLKPETYIFEHNGATPDSVFHNYNYTGSDNLTRSPGQQEVLNTNLSQGFHTIGLRWSAGELLFYVDDQPTYRIIGENVAAEDMYLILNLAVGGNWAGSPDGATVFPADLIVDYVRVYQPRI